MINPIKKKKPIFQQPARSETAALVSKNAHAPATPMRFGHHSNALGFFRLLFASLVILSHTPELYDGNRNREILTIIFGSLSFGELAVDGFFVISGYLISASFLKSKSPAVYLKKRVARIYPGFLVAYLLCCFVVAPLGGASLHLSLEQLISIILRALLLQPPNIGDVFNGTAYPVLNGAMWTISYEFRCYIFVLALGLLGLLEKRIFILIFAIGALALSCLTVDLYHPFSFVQANHRIPDFHTLYWGWQSTLFGRMSDLIRLFGVFLGGVCFYLYRDKISFTRNQISISLLGLLMALFFHRIANAGTVIFGGYLVFAIASIKRNGVIVKINNENDISYGVYLYAWPTTKLLLWFWPSIPLLMLGGSTFVVSLFLGWLSWVFIEKPVLVMIR